MALVPACTIALTVLAFNLVGNGLRDALDVKSAI
jgi:ABC-type dipeptide/oligopeptide/nickel transport system permease subunit